MCTIGRGPSGNSAAHTRHARISRTSAAKSSATQHRAGEYYGHLRQKEAVLF
jgi:hypothetical protein